ncbi:MAG: SRPBCC family protein [Candidatus Dormibacteria bacterium]
MPEVRHRVVIPVSAETAWDFIADVRNAPLWMFGVKEVTGSVTPPLQPGDRLHIRLVAGGKFADSEWVIGVCERPSLVSSRGHAMGATAELRIECTPVGDRATEVSQQMAYQLPGGALGYLAGRFGVSGILEMQAHHSLQSLLHLLTPSRGGQSWHQTTTDVEAGEAGPG